MWLPSPSPLLSSAIPLSFRFVRSLLFQSLPISSSSISSLCLRSFLVSFDLFFSAIDRSLLFFSFFPIDRSVLASYLFSSFNLFLLISLNSLLSCLHQSLISFDLLFLSPSIIVLLLISFDLLMAPSVSSLLFSSLLFSSLLFSSLLFSSLLFSSLLFSSLLFSSLLSLPALSDDSCVSPIARGNALSNLCRKAWGIVVIAYSRQTEGYWFQLDLTRTDKDKTVLSYNHVKHVLMEEFIQVSQDEYTMSSMVRMLQFIFVSCSCSELPYSLHSRILFVSLLSL